jgi:hypothetical protein
MPVDQNIIRRASMAEYVAALIEQGATVAPGTNSTYWITGERYSLEREPVGCLDGPSRDEVRRALWRTRSAVATYNRPADAAHPQNAWFYLCRDQSYQLEKLESTACRDARRALREFHVEFIDGPTLLRAGAASFCETRSRLGLSDGTPSNFHKYFLSLLKNPAVNIVGAWRKGGDEHQCLAAFMKLVVVDDWVDIAAYSASEYLRFCPTNGLIHFAMDYFLVQRKLRLISYGFSSIQEMGKADTLHRFKLKVGFEAVPVHRAFVFHPLLRPLANTATLWELRLGARLRPSNRRLRKAAGMLAAYLGKHPKTVEPDK